MFANRLISRIKITNLFAISAKNFTGKTETGWKYTTPLMKMKSCKPIIPPPGDNLHIPDWTPKLFCERIGGDCHDVADKFENIKQIFESDSEALKAKSVPVKQRKYLLRVVHFLRSGILNFEYLAQRTALKPCRKLTIAQPTKGGKGGQKKQDKK